MNARRGAQVFAYRFVGPPLMDATVVRGLRPRELHAADGGLAASIPMVEIEFADGARAAVAAAGVLLSAGDSQ